MSVWWMESSDDPKTRSRMTTAITFSRQNDAGSRVTNTQYWENLVLVVVLVSESVTLSTCLYYHFLNISEAKIKTSRREESLC